MKLSLVFLFVIIYLPIACQQTPPLEERGPKKIALTDKEFKALKTLYDGANKIYQYSKSQSAFGAYIKEAKIQVDDLVDLYQTTKNAWETLKELKDLNNTIQEGSTFLVSLKTVQALKESAIGVTMKLDGFISNRIQSLNEKYFVDELISYYQKLVNLGRREFQQRLDELVKRKNELVKVYPKNISELIARYPPCELCYDFYLYSEGANIYIKYSDELARLEQFPGIMNVLKSINRSGPRSQGYNARLLIDQKLTLMLDALYHYQTKDCSFRKSVQFKYHVNKIMMYVLDNNRGYVANAKKTRRERIEAIKDR